MEPKLKTAVVGLGFGANHARVLDEMEGVQLSAICDSNPEKLAAAVSGSGVRKYSDHGQLLREEPLDAVVVAVPTRFHETVALDAITAKCAVFIEKPLARSHPEGLRIVQAAEAAGVALMPGHIERFNPVVQEVHRRIKAGEAGQVIQLRARRFAYFADRTRDVDIGVVHDLAFHEIDVMRLLLGTEVHHAYAEIQANVQTPFDDSISALLRFESANGDSGVVGTIEVDWLSPRKVRELSILGTNGVFSLDYDAKTLQFQQAQRLSNADATSSHEEHLVRLKGDKPSPPVTIPIESHEPLAQELTAFMMAVRNGTPAPVSGADALATLAIADALLESARTGQPVKPGPGD